MSGPLESALGFFSAEDPVFQLEAEIDGILSRVAFDDCSLKDFKRARQKLRRWEKFVKSNLPGGLVGAYPTSPVLLALGCLREAYFEVIDTYSEITSFDERERAAKAEEILGENFFLGGDSTLLVACEINRLQEEGHYIRDSRIDLNGFYLEFD